MSNIEKKLSDLLHDPKSCSGYNVEIAQKIGIEEAIILSELLKQNQSHKTEEKLINIKDTDGKWFYCSVETLEKRTSIKQTRIYRLLRSLNHKGLISFAKSGYPGLRHFQINEEEIKKMFA